MYVCMYEYMYICMYTCMYVCMYVAEALEALETTDIEENSPRTAAIITDSRISLDSIKNVNNHTYRRDTGEAI